jgi:hypothetical protein
MKKRTTRVLFLFGYVIAKLLNVDWSERRETPAGVRSRGDTTGALGPRRLPATPAESEAPGAEINIHLYLLHSLEKIPY